MGKGDTCMNKKMLSVGIILTSSFVLAGCTMPGASSPTSSQAPAQTMTEAAKFALAMQSGSPTKCTVTKDSNVMEYFIEGKKMRANTTTTVTDKTGKTITTVGHMINETQMLYVWSDGQTSGTKMVIPSPVPSSAPTQAEATTKNSAPTLGSEADYQNFQNQGYTINCQTTSVDATTFTPPSDVKFIDPTAMMRQVVAPGTANGVPSQADIEKLKQQYSTGY